MLSCRCLDAHKLEETLQEFAALLQLIHEDVTAEEAETLRELVEAGHRIDRDFLNDLPVWIACLDGPNRQLIANLSSRASKLNLSARFGLLRSAQPNVRLVGC